MRRLRLQMMAGGLPLDPDAQAFLTAAGIADNTITTAIDTLVISLKGFGIWTKLKAIYPFVGGTASTHKFNLKDPQDTNAAFRLVFAGGWTHSATGAQPNGTNGYANTYLIPFTSLNQNSAHTSIYIRTNNTSITNRVELGCDQGGFGILMAVRFNGSLGNLSRINSGFTGPKYVPTKTSGYFVCSRTAATITKNSEEGVVKQTIADASSTPASLSIYLGARNDSPNISFYDIKEYAFASIGDGLNDTEVVDFYTAVQAFQTTLGRQV